MVFPHVFWGEDLDTFGCLNEHGHKRGEFFLFYGYHTVSGGPVLIALVAGEAAQTFESTEPTILLHRVLSVLREDPKSVGLMRVSVGSSEDSYKQELPNNFQHSLTIPLQLYTVISREQACGLELVAGGDENRLSYLVKDFGLKLMGPSALGTVGNSLTVSIANARRGREGIARLLDASRLLTVPRTKRCLYFKLHTFCISSSYVGNSLASREIDPWS
ncbi:hypothetical protein GBA52_013919 [Prunus armeniaca]|nr:hypothetical protein GBA52_013919 [Prunus armeniaca]